MEKNIRDNYPEMYQLGNNLYLKYLDNLNMMYDLAKDKIDFSKAELIKGLNQYLEALLIKIMVADQKLQNIEFDFINYILGTNIKNIESMTIYEDILNKIPLFVKLSVLSDKKMDEMLKVIEPTFCQMTYDFLRRLPTYLKFVDGHVPVAEDEIGKMALSPIVIYFKKNYVRYAPKRKED